MNCMNPSEAKESQGIHPSQLTPLRPQTFDVSCSDKSLRLLRVLRAFPEQDCRPIEGKLSIQSSIKSSKLTCSGSTLGAAKVVARSLQTSAEFKVASINPRAGLARSFLSPPVKLGTV